MSSLILHVGPGKCGSSSIQQFFATHKHPCVQATSYKLLSPSLITAFNCEEPDAVLLDSFRRQLSRDLEGCDCLVLSHEFLFQNPFAVKSICSSAVRLAQQITIIGYSRKQSDFLLSAYSQWLFRSADRIKEVNNSLVKLGLDPVLFTGLERQFIASIENDFYSARMLSGYSILHWSNSYNNIFQLVHEYGVVLKCGVLPNRETDVPLIQDFCIKGGLTLCREMMAPSMKTANSSYDHDVIEAINIAVDLGFEMMGPHDDNFILELLSSVITNAPTGKRGFLCALQSYVDAYYWDSNQKLCDTYGLDKAYFLPTEILAKQRVLDVIVREGQQRSLHKSTIIEDYRVLSAKMIELCVKLAKVS